MVSCLGFDDPDLRSSLHGLQDILLDELPFGVIGFDEQGLISRYNACEARYAQFNAADVLGQHLFVELAPCLNNHLVAGRFDEAQTSGVALDVTLPYVLTFRMKPTRVRLRLLAQPDAPLRFVLVERSSLP